MLAVIRGLWRLRRRPYTVRLHGLMSGELYEPSTWLQFRSREEAQAWADAATARTHAPCLVEYLVVNRRDPVS